jgi:hypothetical protein
MVAISLKVMSNYTNHVVQTPVDGVFAAYAWTKAIAVNPTGADRAPIRTATVLKKVLSCPFT